MKNLHSLKSLVWASAIVLPLLAGNVHAQYTPTVWNPAANPTSTGSWDEAANWTGGAVPDGLSTGANYWRPVFNVSGAVTCIVASAASPGQLVIGDGGPGSVIIANGGSMAPIVNDWMAVGYSGTAYLEVQTGASVTLPSHLWIGFQSPSVGTFVLSGGTVTVGQMFGIGWNGGTGTAHINGGTINMSQWAPISTTTPGLNQSLGTGCVLDVAGGTVVITGNFVDSVNAYIANNQITADGGSGTVSVTFNAGLNATVLTDGGTGTTGPVAQNITSITTDNAGNFTLTYVTSPGFTYHVQSTASLEPAPISWTDVPGSTTNSVTGSAVSFTYAPGAGTLFYRTVSP